MTNQVKLHVGYIGKTREGKRVEIVQFDGSEVPFKGDNTCWYNRDGTWSIEASPLDIIGPWTETINTTTVDEDGCEVPIVREVSYKPKPEYETGVWYGWNGGECPVHPETVVEMMFTDGESWFGITDDDVWDQPLLFRIVTPYVEPRKPREVWIVDGAHVYDDKSVALEDMADFNSKDIAHFREVIEADDQ